MHRLIRAALSGARALRSWVVVVIIVVAVRGRREAPARQEGLGMGKVLNAAEVGLSKVKWPTVIGLAGLAVYHFTVGDPAVGVQALLAAVAALGISRPQQAPAPPPLV